MGLIKDKLRVIFNAYKLGTFTSMELIWYCIKYIFNKIKWLTRLDGFITAVILVILFNISILFMYTSMKMKYTQALDRLDYVSYRSQCIIDSLNLVINADSSIISQSENELTKLRDSIRMTKKRKIVTKKDSIY